MTRLHHHTGVVTEVQGNKMSILLTETGGCSTCSKTLCVLGETGPKQIDVPAQPGITVGSTVRVSVKEQTAYLAMVLLYGIPFVLLMSLVWYMVRQGYSEGVSGVMALAALTVYYTGLYFLRDVVAGKCTLNVMHL